MYSFLNIFFIVFHSSLIVFNLFGWIWKPLRKANLVALILTLGSWIFLGIFYGFGYCPCTDWHYRVLGKLGATGLPDSYIQYLIGTFTNLNVSQSLTDAFTLSGLLVALACSVYVNVIARRFSGFIFGRGNAP